MRRALFCLGLLGALGPAQVRSPEEIVAEVARIDRDAPTTLGQFWKSIGIAAEEPERECTMGCQARVLKTPRVLPAEDAEALVLVETREGHEDRLLVLAKRAGSWRLVSHLDIDTRYGPPEISVVQSAGLWLRVRGYDGGGSGVGFRFSDWYAMWGGKFQRLFSLAARGWDLNYNPGREFSARLDGIRKTVDGTRFRFRYQVVFRPGFFSGGDTKKVLWTETGMLEYFCQEPTPACRMTLPATASEQDRITKLMTYDSVEQAELELLTRRPSTAPRRTPR